MTTRVAIVGSRGWTDLQQVRDRVMLLPEGTIVISGGARGVDREAESAARERGLEVVVYRPDYDAYPGQIAPLKRNQRIAEECDAMIAFWDGVSTGTLHVMGIARRLGKHVEVVGPP